MSKDLTKVINYAKFETLQSAWEELNEQLLCGIDQRGQPQGVQVGNQWFTYNNVIEINRATMDPEFDLGKKLGYAPQKWNTLVKNYLDFGYLDLIRAHISTNRVAKNQKAYNDTIHFSNHYASGKDCLISLTFSKRPHEERPIAVFHIRTSEITKRLPFDFLLVQRICEHVYGHNDVIVQLWAPTMYITVESITMFENINPLPKVLKWGGIKKSKLNAFQQKVMKTREDYLNHPDPESIVYRVNRRACMQIQKDSSGEPISGVKSMKVKTLKLFDTPDIPSGIITRTQLRKHQKQK